MSDTSIEWTDKTWNPVRGCSLVSQGCRSCYAMKTAYRFSGPGQPYEGLVRMGASGPVWTGNLREVPGKLAEPLSWRKPARVFVNSMSDLFHEDVPVEFIEAVFGVMALAGHHTYQVLTKRAARMAEVVSGLTLNRCLAEVCVRPMTVDPKKLVKNFDGATPWPLPNVHLGTSVEDQGTADARIPHLLRTPAAVRFLSVEPLLGPVNLTPYIGAWCGSCGWVECERGRIDRRQASPLSSNNPCPTCDRMVSLSNRGIGWVIVGGESGPGARPMHPDWVRKVHDDCVAAGVPLFVKQDSGPKSGVQGRIPADLWAHKEFPRPAQS